MKNILKRIAVVVVLFATVANMWVANTNKEVNLNTSLESLEAEAIWPVWVVEILIGLVTTTTGGVAVYYLTSSSNSDNSDWIEDESKREYLGYSYCGATPIKKYKVVKYCMPIGSSSNCRIGDEEVGEAYVY